MQTLTNKLVSASKEYGMEISKAMLNSLNINEHVSIVMDGTMLKYVKYFKYIGSTIKYDG